MFVSRANHSPFDVNHESEPEPYFLQPIKRKCNIHYWGDFDWPTVEPPPEEPPPVGSVDCCFKPIVIESTAVHWAPSGRFKQNSCSPSWTFYMRMDAHHHFWHYSPAEYAWIDESKQPLQQDFLPNDLKREIDANQIDGVISVQARQSVAETKTLLSFAESNDWIKAVVGWVPLRDETLTAVLDELTRDSRLRAVRHVVQDELDDRFMMRDDFLRGIAKLHAYNLVYDLLVFPHQLAAAIELVERFPDQIFVLDHIAKPRIELGAIDQPWLSLFTSLAKRPNVYCKFSGVITEVRDTDWTLSTIRPYWEIAIDAFGPSRLMFGTDWPVCLLRGSYTAWTSAVSELASALSITEQHSFWGNTATAAYSLR